MHYYEFKFVSSLNILSSIRVRKTRPGQLRVDKKKSVHAIYSVRSTPNLAGLFLQIALRREHYLG